VCHLPKSCERGKNELDLEGSREKLFLYQIRKRGCVFSLIWQRHELIGPLPIERGAVARGKKVEKLVFRLG